MTDEDQFNNLLDESIVDYRRLNDPSSNNTDNFSIDNFLANLQINHPHPKFTIKFFLFFFINTRYS
jgi:hypothetical protein